MYRSGGPAIIRDTPSLLQPLRLLVSLVVKGIFGLVKQVPAMKALLYFALVIVVFSCHPETRDTPNPGQQSPPDDRAITEVQIEGVGKAQIVGQSIIVKVPATYTKNTVRLFYTVAKGVKTVTPASGTELPLRGLPYRVVCVQQDSYGNCILAYQLIIETPSPLIVSINPSDMQLTPTQYWQPYQFNFGLKNLKTDSPVTRRFQIQFVNKATQYTHTGTNYMVYNLAEQPLFVNQLNQAPFPNEGTLRMTGSLPPGMSAGEYTVTIQVPTCYNPLNDGRCYSFGYDYVELPNSFILKAGPPIIGEVNTVLAQSVEVSIKGRNLLPAKAITVRLKNDFTAVVTSQATVQNDTIAQLILPNSQPAGQYLLDVAPEGGKSNQSLFVVPSKTASSSFAYVAPIGSFATTQNWLPVLPVFKSGASLEVRYSFTAGDKSYGASMNRTVKQVRLINTTNTALTYMLKAEGSFRPFALATDFFLWKWTIPANLPTSEYSLVFDDFDGTGSVAYYQKIRIE